MSEQERKQGPPRRRVVAHIGIGADSREELLNALRAISFGIAAERMTDSVSGGVSYGWTVRIDEDESITHDSWYAELQAWLEHEHAALQVAERIGEQR
jgi:hypothetical protein